MDITLRSFEGDVGDVEVVEHKGIGHPDTICDGLAEALAVALSRHYLERFGAILHFNVDKTLLVGGESKSAFGGGEIVAPMRVILAGRATNAVRGVRVPVEEIAADASQAWMRAPLHALDPASQVAWDWMIRPGSADLVDLFLASEKTGGPPVANDTSVGAGYAPMSPLERTVLAIAARMRGMTSGHPEVGEDVKVMGVRHGGRTRFTIACALVDRHVSCASDYADSCREIRRAVLETAEDLLRTQVSVDVNAADDLAAGRLYLTVTGTSAEAGDDGQVGRGNRINGLITPYRPMSLEASAGKNPVSHVGKLYNVAAARIARALVNRVPLVAAAECYLVSAIGRRVDDPLLVDVRLRLRDGAGIDAVRAEIDGIVREQVKRTVDLSREIVTGSVRMF